MAVNLCVLAEDTAGQLGSTHLQAEQGYTAPVLDGGGAGDAQYKTSLTHRRAGGDDDKIRRLEAGGKAIELGEAGRHPGQPVFFFAQHGKLLQQLVREGAHIGYLLTHVSFGDFEDVVAGLVEQVQYIGTVFVGILDDLGARTDELTLDEFLSYDPGVVFNIGRTGHLTGKLGEVSGTTYLIQYTGFL